jgi:hypothetical protein
VQHEQATVTEGVGGHDRDLDANMQGRAGVTFADARIVLPMRLEGYASSANRKSQKRNRELSELQTLKLAQNRGDAKKRLSISGLDVVHRG